MTGQELLFSQYIKNHPRDAVKVLENFLPSQVAPFVQELSLDISERIISQMSLPYLVLCLNLMEKQKIEKLLERQTLGKQILILRSLNEDLKESILQEMPDKSSRHLRNLLTFPKSTAGYMMNPAVFSLPYDITVKKAQRLIKFSGNLNNSLYYVVDPKGIYKGYVTGFELLKLQLKSKISDILFDDIKPVNVNRSLVSVIKNSSWSKHYELPVTDSSGLLVGFLKWSELEKIIHSETTKEESAIKTMTKALGELYWLGMSGIIRGTTIAISDNEERRINEITGKPDK